MQVRSLLLALLGLLSDAFPLLPPAGIGAPGRGSGAGPLFGKRSGPAGRIVDTTFHADLDAGDGSDAWRAQEAVDLLRRGGCGVLPTDTSYSFVTLINSKQGLERILRIKGVESCKKPLSMVVADLATIDRFSYGIDRQVFKILKKNLPGPVSRNTGGASIFVYLSVESVAAAAPSA